MPLSFRRNQLERAVWQVFAANAPASEVPKVFRSRIKRLLDLDRDLGPRDEFGFGYAYFEWCLICIHRRRRTTLFQC